MSEPSSNPPGYYTCTSCPGQVIYLSYEAVDGMLSEIMTGFGAIPRRGAEVGGLLLGRKDGQTTWIVGFAAVACEHRRGPSFLLSDTDRELLDETFQQKSPHGAPVGMFRSNTREQNSITDEDRELLRAYFPAPSGTFLFVRPYATKSSIAGFICYQDGQLPAEPAETFAFSRRDLDGSPPPRRRALNEPRPRAPEPQGAPATPPPPLSSAPRYSIAGSAAGAAVEDVPQTQSTPDPETPLPAYTALSESPQRRRRGWVWIPFSFTFLALGLLLGFQSALTFYPHPPALEASEYSLGLSATTRNDNVLVRWNRESPVIRAAEHGRLNIKDGSYNKLVELDSGALQTGSVMYPPVSANVTLEFQISLKGSTTVVERLDWARNR